MFEICKIMYDIYLASNTYASIRDQIPYGEIY